MIPTDRYCHSGPGNGDNSILTKLLVMPFCRGAAVILTLTQLHTTWEVSAVQGSNGSSWRQEITE